MNFGLRQTRFTGKAKVKLQSLFTVTVANIKRLAILQKPKELLCQNVT
jgi:IS5 family transposase